MNKTVALVRCEEYNPDFLIDKIRESYEFAGGKKALDVSGKSVLLKPNILMDAVPSRSVTTNPEFVRAVIRLVKELGASEIYIGDSPGFPKPGYKGKNCGIWSICSEENVTWYDFSSRPTTIKCPDGKMVNEFQVSDIVDKVDVIISLPKLKTHQLMFYTGAIKNQFGLITGLSKSPYHMMFPGRSAFAGMLVDLNQALQPSFAFMDGIISMEGPGPGNGIPKKTDIILASSNILALDITACRIIGYDPDIIPTNREALDRGLWLESSNDIEITGMDLSEAKIPDFQKIQLTGSNNQLLEFLSPPFIKQIRTALSPRPVFRENKCIRCGACTRICPAKALKMKDMVKIDYNKCIRCFCCHEVCPEDAIVIKRTLSNKGIV